MVTYTGQVTNTSTTDKNNGVLLKVVADTGNVGRSLHTVGKSYSGDLTKSRVRLLGGNGCNLGADASSLRCRLVDSLVLESVEASLENGGLGLVCLVLTTLLNEMVKGWHDFPPFAKNKYLHQPPTKIILHIIILEPRRYIHSYRQKGAIHPSYAQYHYSNIKQSFCQYFFEKLFIFVLSIYYLYLIVSVYTANST